MAIIGSTIGAAFAISFVAAPGLEGRPWACPASSPSRACSRSPPWRWCAGWFPRLPDGGEDADVLVGLFRGVARSPELIRLNVGIFTPHAVLMAVFIVVARGAGAGVGCPQAQPLVDLPWAPWPLGLRPDAARGRPVAPSGARQSVFLAAVATVAVGHRRCSPWRAREHRRASPWRWSSSSLRVQRSGSEAARPGVARGAGPGAGVLPRACIRAYSSSGRFVGSAQLGGAIARSTRDSRPCWRHAWSPWRSCGSPWRGTWESSSRRCRHGAPLEHNEAHEKESVMASVNKVIINRQPGSRPGNPLHA